MVWDAVVRGVGAATYNAATFGSTSGDEEQVDESFHERSNRLLERLFIVEKSLVGDADGEQLIGEGRGEEEKLTNVSGRKSPDVQERGGGGGRA